VRVQRDQADIDRQSDAAAAGIAQKRVPDDGLNQPDATDR
jgi:hypothetical protein